MESTPTQRKAFTDFYHKAQAGDVPTTGPTRPDAKLTRGVSDLLAGKKAPSDTPDVPEGVDADVWADANRAARDPQDPAHAIADALLTVAAALADLKSQQEAQP